MWLPFSGKKEHSNSVMALKWNSAGSLLATGGRDNTVFIWDAYLGTIKQRLKSHKDTIYSIAWINQNMLASCSKDKEVQIWNVGEKNPIQV